MIPTEKPLQKPAEVNSKGTKQRSTNLISRDSLVSRLNRGRDARTRFVESHLDKGIAFQLRALRDREQWSQQELAEKIGMTQNAISRLESHSYGKPTLTTLKRLASVYDVALVVRFVPFSELVDWVSGTPRVDYGMSSSSFDIPAFDRDSGLAQSGQSAERLVPAPPLPRRSGNVAFTAETKNGKHGKKKERTGRASPAKEQRQLYGEHS